MYDSSYTGEQIDAAVAKVNGLESKTAASGGTDESLVTTGEKYTWNGKQDAISNMARLGFAYGVCETATGTAAKTVTISDFILLNGCIVSVLMANRMNESSPTINVSNTGAKPLWYHGASMPTNIVKPNTTLILQYDGTHWNVVGIEHSKASFNDCVDLDLPSGTLWATKNIDVTQQGGFAISEFQYECSFFSWGNTDGHNPTSTSSFGDYSFGTENDTEPYVSSPGAAIEYPASAGLAYDAARVNCGAPWRLPTTEEFAELFANIDYIDANGDVISSETADKRVTVNGVLGLYCRSKNNGEVIFFPCSGLGNGTSWNFRGSYGYYWSSSLYSQTYGRLLYFDSGGVGPQDYSRRFSGFAVRPVQ